MGPAAPSLTGGKRPPNRYIPPPLRRSLLPLGEPGMTTAFDVPAPALITATAKSLHEVKEIAAPEWAPFVKTGIHTEKPPVQTDWWHTRVAAVLRKVYTDGPIGTETLRAHFGGFRDRGNRPHHAVKD